LIVLAAAAPFVTVKGPFHVLGLLLWGFGVWWLVMAISMTLHRAILKDLPFSLTWWAFTFPLGAFAAASWRLGELFKLGSVWAIGLFAYGLLIVLRSAAFINSVLGAVSGRLFASPPPARSNVTT
jgi:tellurite resistance protein TehA-like permease